MSTPGCFSFLKKAAPEPPAYRTEKPYTANKAMPAEPKSEPTQPRLPEAHEHYEPCFCAEVGSGFGKMALDAELPAYSARSPFSSDARDAIKTAINDAAPDLTKLSLWISDHPELGYNEVGAHKHLTAYLEDAGFKVEREYKGVKTAFRASYKYGKGGRIFGFNSEYDALPGVGHACGHNLIAVSGVAAAVGTMAGMKKAGIDGEVVLIGTPAEEGGVGKGVLLDKGGYAGLEACMMIHPVGGMGVAAGTAGVAPTLAINTVNVEFFGKTSHAGGAPWDGVNALDAVNIAYSSISAMRQQMHPTDRVHGIIIKGGDAPNIIPDHTSMKYFVRAQSAAGVEDLVKRVKACFDGAAKATGCDVKYSTERMMYDLRNNLPISEEYAAAMGEEYHLATKVAIDDWGMAGGSTDFGNVTYAMPAVHPHYGVNAPSGRGNHTIEFRNACRTDEAHDVTYKFAAGMAFVAVRFMKDAEFARDVKEWFDDHTKA